MIGGRGAFIIHTKNRWVVNILAEARFTGYIAVIIRGYKYSFGIYILMMKFFEIMNAFFL